MVLTKLGFASFCFAMMCGSVTLMASYLFVERIYKAATKGEFRRI